jgi:SNF2 family DNA or RNA helicase
MMASIMNRDPWTWTVKDTIEFFARHARSAMVEMPNGNLPPVAQITANFVAEQVDGATLLSYVDDNFLRESCRITTLGQRAAVYHCINKLRAISPGYKAASGPTIWPAIKQPSEPVEVNEELLEKLAAKLLVPGGRLVQLLAGSHAAPVTAVNQLLQTASEPMQLDKIQPSIPNTLISDEARPYEVLVKGKDGKKRRRLDLAAINKEGVSISQAFSPDDNKLSLPARRFPIDNVFFGDTAFGKERGPMKVDHPLYVHEGSNDEEFDERNFQYINIDLHLGVSAYVGARLQRSMLTHDEVVLSRPEGYAVAKFFYPTGLQAERTKEVAQYGRHGRITFGGTRSALLVQRRAAIDQSVAVDDDDFEDPWMATRENEAILSSGVETHGVDQADLSGEHEHLLLKYKYNEDDLMPESDPESDPLTEDGLERHDDMSTEFDDDQAKEDDDDEVAKTDVKEIIDRVLDEYIAKWREVQLPKLEARKAWTVWKQTRRSQTVREQLVLGARTEIERLQSRLRTARGEIELSSWEEKASVKRSCKNLEATVEDIERQQWNIDVWLRRREPDHVSARKAKNIHAAGMPTDTQHHNQLAVDSQDRLSVSPRPYSPPGPPPTDPDDDQNSDVECEHFHTPQGSPVLQPEDSPFVVQDDDMEVDDFDQATAGASMKEEPDEPAADAHQSNDTPRGPSRAELLRTPTAAARFQDLTSTDMPSPSVLAQRSYVKASPAASVIDRNDLCSSSIDPQTPVAVKSKTRRKRRRTTILSDIDNKEEAPSISEADQWRFSDLVEREDRNKLLIKLLRDMGQKYREDLWKTYQTLGLPTFVTQLLVGLDTLISPRDEPSSGGDAGTPSWRANNPKNGILKLGARLLLAFYFLRPDAFLKSTLPEDILAMSMPKRGDVESFAHVLKRFLLLRNQPLYSSPMPPTTADDPIVIDTDDDAQPHGLDEDDDSDVVALRSHRKRKKTKLDVDAENRRKAARARLEESQQQRSYNSSVLQSMVLAHSEPGDKLINPLRKADQEPIFIEASIAKRMKSYQLEGVQFLWRELTSDPDEAQGCLLAHTMGLGKTMQSIALLHCVDVASQSPSHKIVSQLPLDLQLGADRQKRSLRFLIICPSSLLQNWRRELQDWVHRRAFGGNVSSIETTVDSGYIKTLGKWRKNGGVLLVGYPLFQRIVNCSVAVVAEKHQSDAEMVAKVKRKNEDAELACKIITEDTELVVADEAHHLKNANTGSAKAASKIVTNARIALTGTPMSNDVDEIYALIDWVSPGFLGDRRHFGDYFGVPIKNGLYVDSSSADKRKSIIKLKSLHHEIEPKVHRAGISVLKGELKPKVEFVITVELTEQQRKAYTATVAALLGATKDLNLTALTSIFAWLGVLGLLTAHPRCFRQKLLTPKPPAKEPKRAGKAACKSISAVATKTEEADVNDTADAEAAGTNEGCPELPSDESVYALGFTEAIVNELVADLSDSIDPALSAKTRLLQKILQLSQQCGDKVLIFSASIPSLNYLSDLLKRDQVPFGRIDGSMKMEDRTKLLAKFQNSNQQGRLEVLLISTRAGGQGLNIQSANRVIIFDFGFNPAWEEQAIGRAYRFGQKKPVFVYRFVAGGTFESNIYNTQMFKTSLASRVVDKKNPHRNAIRHTKEYLYPPRPVKHEDLSNELEVDLDPKVLSQIMYAQIKRGDARDPSIDICMVRTMEVLQAEDQEAPLDPEELRQVEESRLMWQAERSRPNGADLSQHRPMGAPSSTAPVQAGPPGIRTASMPSSTQAAAHLPPQAQRANATHGARDIRNGNGGGGSRRNYVSMDGLPFAGPK